MGLNTTLHGHLSFSPCLILSMSPTELKPGVNVTSLHQMFFHLTLFEIN